MHVVYFGQLDIFIHAQIFPLQKFYVSTLANQSFAFSASSF